MDKTINRRLLPLYASAFLHGFVFFYTFEKLFMTRLGFSNAEIGYMVAVYSAVMLLAEIPSGVLADRWSRKGVLILGSIALALSAIVGGTSFTKLQFILSTVFWGIYYAFHSGTYESIVYDTILEEKGSVKNYDRLYGRVKVLDSIALVIGSLGGGLLGSSFGLRVPYFVTAPLSLLAIVFLLRFKEPVLHKSKVSTPVTRHIIATFKAITHNFEARHVIVTLLAVNVLLHIMFEFDQLWLIALAVPLGFYGLINALLLSGIGLGGVLVTKLRLRRKMRTKVLFIGMFSAVLLLTLSRYTPLTVLALVFLSISLVANDIIFSRLLHDTLDSGIRAGAASTVGTLSRLIMVPFAVLFGWVAGKQDVFTAGWSLVLTMIILIAFGVQAIRRQRA